MSTSLHLCPDLKSVRYPGGKNLPGVAEWIIELAPPHAYYCEPCVGSGGVFRRKSPALWSVLADVNEEVIAWWRELAWPGTEIFAGDGIRWLIDHRHQLDREWLVYIDPPYPHATRTKRRLYAAEWTDADHARMLDCVTQLGHGPSIMISTYDNALYAERLSGWHTCRRSVITRGGTMRDEVLFMNFDPDLVRSSPLAMAAAAGVGKNFRERERIKRKRARRRRRFASMSHAERAAILAALLEAEGSLRRTSVG